MKNLAIIIAFLAVVGLVAYTFSQKSSSPSDSALKKDEIAISPSASSDKTMMDKSVARYIEYSKAIFEQTVDKRRVLYFYANWCPSCRPADINFKENMSKIPEDVAVIRVNYSDTDTDQEEKNLAKNYGITYQHTFVQIDSQGKEVTKWNGGQINELLANIK